MNPSSTVCAGSAATPTFGNGRSDRLLGPSGRGRPPPQDGAPGDVRWRSIPKDNILSLYGFDANSRIADPLEPSRI